MNERMMLIAAVGLGIFAAVVNWIYLSNASGEALTVLRVKEGKPIATGSPVTSSDVEAITLYGDVGQLGRIALSPSELASYRDLAVAETLKPGDIVLLSAFQPRPDSGIRSEIGPGERAITVNVVDEANAVAYFVRPGDVVDIWGIIDGRTYLLKDHARLSAVGEKYGMANAASEDKWRTVTLVVRANDVEPLVYNLARAATVKLSLLGPEDAKMPSGPALAPVEVVAKDPKTGMPITATKPAQPAQPTQPAAQPAPGPALPPVGTGQGTAGGAPRP